MATLSQSAPITAMPPPISGGGGFLRSDGEVSLLRKMAKAVAWTGVGLWSTQLLTWVGTFTVARALTPADYGLIGMAMVYVGLVLAFSEFGVGTTVINLRELSDAQVAQMNTVSIIFGLAAFLLSCVCAVPLGWFFHAPQLPLLIMVMSLAFVITSAKTVPAALLQRRHDFRALARIDAAASVVYAATCVVTVLAGWGYWSLVAGQLAWLSAKTVLTLMAEPLRLAWPQFTVLRFPLKFSTHIIVSDVSWYFYTNADFLMAGRLLGQAALGAYSIAWTIASAPVERLTSMVMRAVPAFFAAAYQDKAALRSYVFTLTEVVAIAVLPLGAILFVTAEHVILAILGTKWMTAVLPLRILACYMTLRALAHMMIPLLNAQRQAHYTMWTNVAAAIYFPIGFFIASRWGTTGIAGAWIALFPLIAVPLFRRGLREIEMSPRQYLRALWPAASATLCMAVAVLVVQPALPVVWPVGLRLAAELAAAGVAYLTALVLFHRNELWNLIRIAKPA
jgi:teichuronic acid exporter